MIISGLHGDNWFSDGRDWTIPNEHAYVGFLTYAGVSIGEPKKLLRIKVTGKNVPNFDLQASTDMKAWTSLAEVTLKEACDGITIDIPDDFDSFTAYRVLVNSREPWIVDKLDFEVE